MKSYNRILAAFLAVFMLIATGCSASNTTWAYEHDGEKLPAGIYIQCQMQAYNEAVTKITEENAENEDFDQTALKQSAVMKMTVEGQKAADWIDVRAKELVQEYYGVEQWFQTLGLSLDADERGEIAVTVESYWKSVSAYYESNGVALSSFEKYMENGMKRQALYSALYFDGGELAPTQAELEAAFLENYAKADAMYFAKTTEVEDEAQDLEAVQAEERARAEGYRDRLIAGEEIEELAYEYQLELTDEADKDTVTKPEPGTLNVLLSKSDGVYYGEEFVNGMFDAQVGTPVLIEDDYSWILINKLELEADEETVALYTNALTDKLVSEGYSAALQERAATLDLKVNQAAIDRYKVTNLKMDF